MDIFIVNNWKYIIIDSSKLNDFIFDIEKTYLTNRDQLISLYLLKFILGNVITSRTEYGKPYLINDSRYVNWTHDEKNWILAVSEIGNVGIDVESKDIPFDIDMYGWILHEEELNKINEGVCFAEIWTRKEAILKYTGEGINDNMNELNCYEEIDRSISSLYIDDYLVSVCSKFKENININFLTMDN